MKNLPRQLAALGPRSVHQFHCAAQPTQLISFIVLIDCFHSIDFTSLSFNWVGCCCVCFPWAEPLAVPPPITPTNETTQPTNSPNHSFFSSFFSNQIQIKLKLICLIWWKKERKGGSIGWFWLVCLLFAEQCGQQPPLTHKLNQTTQPKSFH